MSLWNMTPMEWCTFLNNFLVWLIAVDGLLSCCITRENWNSIFIRRHVRRYAALLIGCAIMNFGVNLKSMDWMLNISLIGWLIWMPALFFVIKNLFAKFKMSKNPWGIFLQRCLKVIVTICGHLIMLPFAFFAAIASAKSSEPFESEQKQPYANPLNEHMPGLHNVFPNEYARNRVDLIDD